MTYTITSRIARDGFKTWGFVLSDGFRQLPCWPTKRAAIESAKFHIAQRENLPPYIDTCIEHGPGGTLRLSYQIRVF